MTTANSQDLSLPQTSSPKIHRLRRTLRNDEASRNNDYGDNKKCYLCLRFKLPPMSPVAHAADAAGAGRNREANSQLRCSHLTVRVTAGMTARLTDSTITLAVSLDVTLDVTLIDVDCPSSRERRGWIRR